MFIPHICSRGWQNQFSKRQESERVRESENEKSKNKIRWKLTEKKTTIEEKNSMNILLYYIHRKAV
jgi:hypothetical protein